MIVQSAYREAPSIRPHEAEKLRRPKCPRCKSVLVAAEESTFNARGRIDHRWSCDDCGNAFVTSIRLWRRYAQHRIGGVTSCVSLLNFEASRSSTDGSTCAAGLAEVAITRNNRGEPVSLWGKHRPPGGKHASNVRSSITVGYCSRERRRRGPAVVRQADPSRRHRLQSDFERRQRSTAEHHRRN